MSFLDLKKGLILIPLLIPFLFVVKERNRLSLLREEIIELHQRREKTQSYNKESVLETLNQSDYCGVTKDQFFVLKFKKNNKLDIWVTPLAKMKAPYPPKVRKTIEGYYHLEKGALIWEHRLMGQARTFEYHAQQGVQNPFQILRNPHSLFSPRLCTISASL